MEYTRVLRRFKDLDRDGYAYFWKTITFGHLDVDVFENVESAVNMAKSLGYEFDGDDLRFSKDICSNVDKTGKLKIVRYVVIKEK